MTGATSASATVPGTEEGSVEERILKGAAEAFGQYGYAETSVEAILEATGVSRRTFYRTFRNKEHVFQVLYDRAVEVVLGAVTRAVERCQKPREKIEAGVSAYLEANRRAARLSRVLLQEQVRPDSALSQQRDRVVEWFLTFIERECRAANVEVDRWVILGAVAGVNHIAMQMAAECPGGDWDMQRARSAMVRILSALGPPPGRAARQSP